MLIGPYHLANPVLLAPMAGVTDRPFRQLCRGLGAGMAVSEMVAANPKLWGTPKSERRTDHQGETGVISVQIAGSDPGMLAEAAQYNVERGAQIIDINMGCPAKKVCNKLAGSALLANEALVKDILNAVVNAVRVPVTLKIRTGSSPDKKNGAQIARIAEDAGIQALAVHGRTRACKYQGHAEYDSIRIIKQLVSIPIIANGDITTPQRAKSVLEYTGADAVMVGRAAQGNPWLFREINHYLKTGTILAGPSAHEVSVALLAHVRNLHEFYGEYAGVRIARKHIGWYMQQHRPDALFRQQIVKIDSPSLQLEMLSTQFARFRESGFANASNFKLAV